MEIIRFPAVNSITGLSRSTVWRLEQDKDSGWPMRIQLGPKSVGWPKSEVEAWVESRPRGALVQPAGIADHQAKAPRRRKKTGG